MGFWRACWIDLRDGLLDRRCAGCAGPVSRDCDVCETCDALIPRTGTALCLACMRGDPAVVPAPSGACPRHGSQRLLLAGPSYEPPLDRIVRACKYDGAHRLVPWIASLLPVPEFLRGPLSRECILVPVPLHTARRSSRGFDQALLLAREVSPRWGVPVVRALERTRDTPPQARFDPGRRRENVRGAFRVVAPSLVRGRTVLLVDDVATTGSTLLEAAASLEASGAAWILCLAASHGGAAGDPTGGTAHPVATSKTPVVGSPA